MSDALSPPPSSPMKSGRSNTTAALMAIGNVDEDPDFDVWTIDQENKIEHTHDDLANQE